MTYRSAKSKTGKKYLNIALGVVAFALFMYYWQQFRAVAYQVSEPLIRGYGGAKGGAVFVPEFVTTFFSSRTSFLEKTEELELNVERLENQLAEKDAHIRELGLLSGVYVASSSLSTIVLYPIAEDVTKLYSTLLLSKGYKDGLQKGLIVYVRGLQPVCEIIEVYDRTARCELFSKGDRVTEGVTSSSTVVLSLTGEGGGNFVAEIPKGSFVSVGEQIYLRSNPSFVLGTIVAVKDEEQATGARVYIRGAYNPITSSVFYVNVPYAP